jgi:hypothetical protein
MTTELAYKIGMWIAANYYHHEAAARWCRDYLPPTPPTLEPDQDLTELVYKITGVKRCDADLSCTASP